MNHIKVFFLRLIMLFRGMFLLKDYSRFTCNYGAKDLLIFTNSFGRIEIYYGFKRIYVHPQADILDVNRNNVALRSYDSKDMNKVRIIFYELGQIEETISIDPGDAIDYVFKDNSKYIIFKSSDKHDKYVILNLECPNTNLVMTDSYFFMREEGWNAICVSKNEKFEIITNDFLNKYTYSYVTKFGKDSTCYIAYTIDTYTDEKRCYMLVDDSYVGFTDVYYSEIIPAERDLDENNVFIVPDKVELYVAKKANSDLCVVLDDEGREKYNMDFVTVYPFRNGSALAASKGSGIVILGKETGEYYRTNIKMIYFNFRTVKYGLFTRHFAGVQTFDDDFYIDEKGHIFPIYNKNRFDGYVKEERGKMDIDYN